jgi:hypothetical protein
MRSTPGVDAIVYNFNIIAEEIKLGCFFSGSLYYYLRAGNTKVGSITVLLTSCLTGLESAEFQLTIFVFICKTD